MEHKKIHIQYTESESFSEVPEEDQELLSAAAKSAASAYAPYSGFGVGAAIRLSSGRIITGNNQENAAYPSGLCAERVALFYASAMFPDEKVETIAVTVKTESGRITDPVAPCGACRQVIAEYENRQNKEIKIIFSGETGRVITMNGIQNLLPITFNSNNLNQGK